MNRHQSNPFLAGWDEDEIQQKPPNTAIFDTSGVIVDDNVDTSSANLSTRRYSSSYLGSSTNPNQRPVDRRLYQRNMSSFEAASLHQQLQENGSSNPDFLSGELIAKMTADFKSTMESCERQFMTEDETIEGFNPFDPFETIIDDDVPDPSISSQSNQLNQNERFFQLGDTSSNTVYIGDEDQARRNNLDLDLAQKKNHDSIDDDEADLVSTPVRNIKAPTQAAIENEPTNGDTIQNNQSNTSSVGLNDSHDVSVIDQDGTNSIEKAHLFASLLASAEIAPKIDGLDSNSAVNYSGKDGQTLSLECATHVVRGSPSVGDERPVGFFDPFETVIDRDALTSLMNDTLKGRDESHLSPSHSAEDTDKSGSSNSLKLGHTIGDQKSIETVIENDHKIPACDAVDLGNATVNTGHREQPESQDSQTASDKSQPDRTMFCAIPRPETISRTNPNQTMVAPNYFPIATPVKKLNKSKKKSSSDSSDSSEDEHIKIVIKARDVEKTSEEQPALVPLLPPPPSKSTMKQARERGQVDEMQSPIMSYKKRHESCDSIDEPNKKEIGTSEPADASNILETQQKLPLDQAETDDEDSKEPDDDDGEFVIRMRRSDEAELGGIIEAPLFDDDTSYALEPFPAAYEGDGWTMLLRYPPKKKFTSNRFWKKIGVRVEHATQPADKSKSAPKEPQKSVALHIYNKLDDKKPMQEVPLEAAYTVSDISSQQFDQFGKLFTIKLQYVFYKERVGVRQGQLARFIHTGHIGSSTTSGGHGVDPISVGAIKRLGAPIEHSPHISQIVKLGTSDYNDIKQFKNVLEDHLFRIPIVRDKPLTTYKTEEVQMVVRDETYVELSQIGQISKQLARVRLFFLSFLNGMPTIEVGINDINRQGKEVVGRMDILPVITEEWIRLEAWELHSIVDKTELENTESRLIKFVPPDATFFELMRFRVRPPKNHELPLQISANMSVTRTKVSINVDVMIPGSVSRKYGPISCENIAIRVNIPECWIYQFREEKHFRMGSKKSVKNTPGRIKGMGRFLSGGVGGGVPAPDQRAEASGVIVVSSGQAKYEHHHNAIVWRAAKWPKDNQTAYVQNSMKIHLGLTAYDTMPENFYEYIHVEYSMPATTVSHTTIRSISVNPYEDEPPEKFVKYSAKYEYKVKMLLSVNLSSRQSSEMPNEPSPIVIIKREQDLPGDLQREEDSEDDDEDEDDDENERAEDNG